MTDNHTEAFREEAYELLGDLETSLLSLEEAPDDMELIQRIFRDMHTIKGSGAMFGFDDIAHFTHEIETIYDKVRDGKMPVSKELINLTLQAKDQIRMMLDTTPHDKAAQEPILQETIQAFKELTGENKGTGPSLSPGSASSAGIALPHKRGAGVRDDHLPYPLQAITGHLLDGDKPFTPSRRDPHPGGVQNSRPNGRHTVSG